MWLFSLYEFENDERIIETSFKIIITNFYSEWFVQNIHSDFHIIPYFLQRFTKSLVKTLKHGSLHKNLLVFAKSTSFAGFLQNAKYFCSFLLKTWWKP